MSYLPGSPFGRSLLNGATAEYVRNALGLGTMALQNADSVNITGGTVTVDPRLDVTIVTATGALSFDQDVVLVEGASQPVVLTLPDITADDVGKSLVVKRSLSEMNAVSIDGNGSDTIDGGTDAVAFGVPGESLTLIAVSETAWAIV